MYLFFFFNDTATTEIYTLSLHDALPIFTRQVPGPAAGLHDQPARILTLGLRQRRPARLQHEVHRPRPLAELLPRDVADRSEEHTSELQSRQYLVCRLLLEKKNTNTHYII